MLKQINMTVFMILSASVVSPQVYTIRQIYIIRDE